MYDTTDGQHIQPSNFCSSIQLSHSNNVPLSNRANAGALGVRILPDGSVLAADHYNVQRLDSDGNVVGIYYGFPDNGLAAIALDPDGQTFWTTDTAGSQLLNIDLSHGAILGIFRTSSAHMGAI